MATLLQLMQKSGLNRNQVSKISGISNTYLTKIENFESNGDRIAIRRKTLINIAVSLNLSIVQINSLLSDYNHSEISASDTPYFLAASEKQNVTGQLPLFNSLALEWFLIGLEKKLSITKGASMIYVLDQPSHIFKSAEHASYFNSHETDLTPNVASAYKDLVASACLHRRKLVTEALQKGNEIRTYICSCCLERYMQRWKTYNSQEVKNRSREFLKQQINKLIEYIESYPNLYRLILLKKCPRIKYEMLYLPVPDKNGRLTNKINKVFFHSQESECNKDSRILGTVDNLSAGQGFGDLIGFATDSQNTIELFHKQHIGLNDNYTDTNFDSSQKIVKHLKSLLQKHILK